MKLIIDIDNNVFLRLFDSYLNGIDMSLTDREVIDRAVRLGIPYKDEEKLISHEALVERVCRNCKYFNKDNEDNCYCANPDLSYLSETMRARYGSSPNDWCTEFTEAEN